MKLANHLNTVTAQAAEPSQVLTQWIRSRRVYTQAQSPTFWQQLILEAPTVSGSSAQTNADWSLKKAFSIKAFDFELSDEVPKDLARLDLALNTVLPASVPVVLMFDEQSGLYIQLENFLVPGKAIKEYTGHCDPSLLDLIDVQKDSGKAQYEAVAHINLLLEEGQAGLLVVLGTEDVKPQLEVLLPLIAPQISTLVNRMLRFQRFRSGSFVQDVLLELSNLLVTAVDRDAVITAALGVLTRRLGFDACQYVCFNAETGLGEVHYESRLQRDGWKLSSFSHAGLAGKRRKIKEFANLVGLLSSMVRNRFYLYLNGSMLGQKRLSDIFGIKQAKAALLLPVVDLATGEIQGTFNLFLNSHNHLSQEGREVAQQATKLVSQALSRVLVLEKALAMATSDELTGLMNRRGYYQRFESELERARRHQTPLCVALIDVDHFKRFNDTYGHLSGDLILKALAELFFNNLRRSDLVCRFGGEEFAVLLPDTCLKAAYELMERVRQSVEALEVPGLHGEKMRVTISAGLAEVNTQPKTSSRCSEISDALALADELLYKAKNNGRNQVYYRSDDPEPSQSGSFIA